jgi:cytochrome c oxidase subunit 1
VAARADTTVVPYRSDWRRGRVTTWLTTLDHKRIGILTILTALGFFGVGGVLALLMRAQLATPNGSVLGYHTFNEVLTIHGTTMLYLVVVPILAGFGTYLVPLMIGARSLAFPRLNALSFWFYVLGGVTLYLSFFAKGGTAVDGWTSPAPLSTLHSPGRGEDLWILALIVLSLASLGVAINLVVTIHNMRGAGMTWTRMPLFVWSMLLYAWMLLAALPTFAAGLVMLLLDRHAGSHFFNPAHGGSALLYQNIFWFSQQPEEYLMILPAMGMISEIIPVFARKPIFGYRAVALSSVAIAVLAFLTWGQNLLTAGLPTAFDTVFMVTSLLVAIPVGVKIFNWLATLWRGNISFRTPMLWAIGFISLFTLGGLSGIFLAVYPVEWDLDQTYFVDAHLHYVLFGGAIFAIFGGLYYWWPKIFGRSLDERLGKVHFWLVFLGFNLTFFPQYLLGLLGMTQGVSTYSTGGLWEAYNMVSSIGSLVMAVGMLAFVLNVVQTARSGRRAVNDPWLADTLEWYATSPPPPWNFEQIPYIISARPLRDLRRRLTEKGSL